MNCGYWCEIIDYEDAFNVTVKFDSGYITKCQYSQFKKSKNIKDKLHPTVLNIGIIGDEKITDDKGKQLISFIKWCSMINRCYGKHKNRDKSYLDCSVSKDWLYYPNFKKWFKENFYEIKNETMCLDKDILFKGNKIYSPETCVFVPERINSLFSSSKSVRGCLPIGVSYCKDKKYKSNIYKRNIGQVYIGKFHTVSEAFCAYKRVKEEYIKEIADEYKDRIPKKLYEALYKYEVEITD